MPLKPPLSTASPQHAAQGGHWYHWQRVPQPHDKCQQCRQRWPEMNAVIQVIARIISTLLHMVALVLCLLQMYAYGLTNVPAYPVMIFCIMINTVEILSLTIPAYTPDRHFFRLPSSYLWILEVAAVGALTFSFKYLLKPGYHGNGGCPAESCVLPEEYIGIVAFGCEILNLVLHSMFAVMAMTHHAKRKIPQWLDYWDYERTQLTSRPLLEQQTPQTSQSLSSRFALSRKRESSGSDDGVGTRERTPVKELETIAENTPLEKS